MILTVQLELPGTAEWSGPDRIEILDSEVRDPAADVIGTVGSGRIIWRDGRRYLGITIDVDDQAAVAAATRSGPVF